MRRLSITPVVVILAAAGLLAFLAWRPGTGTRVDDPATIVRSPATKPRVQRPDLISTGFSALSGSASPEASRRTLADLRASLAALPADEAVARIRGFLDEGDDRATGLSFEIAGDGFLSEWPSFRTFLLDSLLLIDPAAAAAVGREILGEATSADEWALGLRNVARGESPEDRGFLLAKAGELIANPAWQADPSIGYLNAFDVLVHVEATESTPLLSELIQRKDRKDLAHAGFLTLDRLVQRQPAEVLARLAADRDLQQSRPEMVAQQFARADLRIPEQQELVKDWLLDPARTPVELRSFAGVYPNNNRFVSNNLLTSESAQAGTDLAAHDRAAMQVVSRWVGDPAFAPVKDHLNTMVSRLGGFVDARDGSPVVSQPE